MSEDDNDVLDEFGLAGSEVEPPVSTGAPDQPPPASPDGLFLTADQVEKFAAHVISSPDRIVTISGGAMGMTLDMTVFGKAVT